MTPRAADARRTSADGVRLYGVLSAVHADARGGLRGGGGRETRGWGRQIATPTGLAAVELVQVRDLVAAVAPAAFVETPPEDAELAATHAIVSTLFAERAVLPAPPGAVFRSREAVAAWLELHAAALTEALRYVEDRVEARVHATRAGPGVNLPGASASAPITDVLRALRREAVAVLVLRDEIREEVRDADPAAAHESAAAPGADARAERPAAPALQAAFLVERARWSTFAAAVVREHDARPDLHLALTGPWPPYDFVRLDLGA